MANWWDSPASPTTAPVAPNPVTPAPDNNLLTYYQRQMAVRPKWTPPDAPYSLSAPSLALSAPPDTQAPTAPEAKAPEAPGVLGSTWNALKGAGVEALKTTQSIGPALYGLADTATGGYLDIGRRRVQAGLQNALGDDTRWQDIDPIAVSQQRTGAMQDELKPDQYRQWEQDVAQQQGAWDKTKATLSHPGMLVGKVAGLAPYLLGGELGLGAKATTAGFGALMGGQSALDAQARVYEKPLEELQKLPDYSPAQSEADNRARLAQQAARPAAALGAAAGVIPGAIAGKALHGPVTALVGGAEKVAASLPRTMAQGVLQQAPEFAAMNAGTTLAGNVGLRAVDPNQPLMENVPETVAEGLLVGGLSGMAVHPVMSRYQGNKGAKAYTAVLDQVHENRAAVPDTDLAKYVANGQELLSKTPMGQTPRADLLDAVTRTQQIIVDRQAAALAQREAAIADYVKRQAPPIPPEATLDPTADPYGAMIQEAAQRDDLWNEQRESLKRNVAHLEQLKQLRVEQDQRAQESARLEAARQAGEAQRQATTPTIPEGYDPTLDTVGRLPTSTLPPGYDPNPSASMGALGQLGPTRLGASQEPSPLVGLLGVKPPDAVRPPVAALEQNPLDLLRQTARPDVVASAPLASEGQLPNGPNEMNRLLGNAPAPAKPPVSEVAPQTPDELLNRPARIQPREGTPDAAQSENAARPVGENQSVSATADHGNADAADEGRADEVRPAESAAGQEQERPAGQEQGQGQEVAPTPPIAADSSTPPEISHDQRSQGRQAQAETETLLNQQPVDPTVPPKESLVGLSYEQLAKLKSEFDAFLDQYGDQHSWVRSADGKMRETIISNRNIWADYGHALTKALNSAPRPPQAEPPPRQPAPPDPRIAAIDERVNRQIAERQQQVDTIKAATLEKMRALKLEAQRRQQAGEDPQTIVADLGPALTTGKQVLDWLEQRAFEARDQRGYSVNLRAQGATLNKIPDWITRHVESVESKESAPPQEGAGKSPATTKPRQSYADKHEAPADVSVGDFITSRPKGLQKIAAKALQADLNGASRAEQIRNAIAGGAVVVKTAKGRTLGAWTEKQLTKHGMDYAEALTAKKGEVVAPDQNAPTEKEGAGRLVIGATPLSPRIQEHRARLLEKARKYDEQKAADFAMRDVTPSGYGPTDPNSESYDPYAIQLSAEQKKIQASINEAKTILRGNISGEKRKAIQESLKRSQQKLEDENIKQSISAKSVSSTPESLAPPKAVPVAAAKQKEPWEMTLEEFKNNLGAVNTDAAAPQERRSETYASRITRARATGENTIPALGITGNRFADSIKAAAREDHGRAIRAAIAAGQAVPAEVLADYPDLVPKGAVGKPAAPVAPDKVERPVNPKRRYTVKNTATNRLLTNPLTNQAHEFDSLEQAQKWADNATRNSSASSANRGNRRYEKFVVVDNQVDAPVVSDKPSAPAESAKPTKQRTSYADKIALRETDDLLTAIAKLGGIDQAIAKREGVDPSEFKRMPVFGKPLFRKTGGRSMDTMAEVLSEAGYPVLDENGYYTVNRLLDQLDAALRGEQIYTPKGYEDMARREAEDRQRQQEADDWALDDVELEASGFNGLADLEQAIADWKVNARKQLGVDKADALFERIAEKSNADSESEFLQELNDAYSREMENGGGGRGSSVRNAPEESGRAATGESPEDFSLSGYSQADLNARAAEVARAQAEQSAKDKAADQKAAADRARGDFVLSGSDRPADVAVAHGQQELAPAAEIPKPTAQNPNAAFNARQGEGGDAPLASRNEPTPDRTPPTREEVTQHLKDVVGKKDAQALLDSGRVRIHDDDSTVPEASRPAGRFAASVDKDGVAHFVLSEMDAATAKGVLAHESGHIGEKLGYFDALDRPIVKVAHAVLRVAGLEGLIGKPTFDNLVEQTRALADKGVASAKDAQDWVNHLTEKGLIDPDDAGRELVSYTLEYAPNNLPLVKRIVATIRAALYRMGVKMQLNEADLLALARSALKSSAKEGRNELTRAGHLLNQMKESPALSGMTGDIYASRPNPLRLAQAAADKVAARLPESAKEFGRRILEEAQLWAAPMAVGTARTQAPAKDYANGVRQTWYEATKTLERLTKDFTPKQHKAMWNGMDATSVWVQQAMNGGMDRDAAMRAAQAQRVGVFALPAAQRDAALALSTRADALWKRAKDAGMVQDDAQGLPFWTPRVAAIIGEDGSFGKPPSKNEGVQNPDHPGIGFTTTSPNLKHRGHVFAADSEAGMQKLFGDKAALVRDIRVMPLAMARLEQAIAGRELINQVKAIGKAIGAEVTSTSPKRGYFTLDHPAFQTFVPRIEKQANGAWEQVQETVTDVDGHTTLRPAFEKQPLYIAKEFEGPLRAVLNTRSGAIYQGLMGLKRGAMSLVMFSPMIHNAVIWGKAFPAMPGKMITGKIYFEGNRAKRDPSLMKEAIGNGLAPINSGAFHPDVPTGLNSLSGHDAGLISTALSKGVGLVNKSAGAALAKGLDQLGGFWHNTMLWDRVADLQMGLYVNLKQHQMDNGLDAQSAGRVAAHFANRYAGAIPQEAMGEGARRLGNLALFSRSFTLGNLAIMKDMLTGLPQDVKAQILRDAGQGAMDKATAAARKKAWVMLAADIGLMYVGNALLQGVVDKLKLDKSLDEIGQGYARRLDKALKAADGNPLQLVNPWSAAFLPDRLSPGSEHEPGKEDRIFTGRDPRTGTASYTRLPTGKVGEELLRWPTRPLEMLRKKQSTLLRPTMEIFANRDHFNNPVYDADAPGLDGMVQRVGQVVGHFLSGQAPVEEAGAAYRSLTGQAVSGDTLKWAGPLMGFTAGRGYPGGPELGAIATAERRHADEIKAMRPEIKRLVDGGQVQEAVRKMTQLGMSPTAQRALIVSVVAPQSRLNSGALMRFYRNATVEEKAKLQDVIDAR